MKIIGHTHTRWWLIGMFVVLAQGRVRADRIYILPGTGYNQCDSALVAAIQANGHTVFVDLPMTNVLPMGFTSTCVDPLNGWDWLCLFGDMNRSSLIPDIQAFTAVGGKVLLQWEINCCPFSAIGSADIASAVTGLPITPNMHAYVSYAWFQPGWTANDPANCMQVIGNAYRCMDGLTSATALVVNADLNGSDPPFTVCPNFGFVFQGGSMPNGNGALLGFGDVNIWYQSADEPPNNGGTGVVDTLFVDAVFPNSESACYYVPPGCSLATAWGGPEGDGMEGEMLAVSNDPSFLGGFIVHVSGASKWNATMVDPLGRTVLSIGPFLSGDNLFDASRLPVGV